MKSLAHDDMSSIWPSGDPMTLPSRLGATSAGAIITVIAFGSLTLGLMSGWQRGASHMPGVEAPSNAVEATPLAGPEVTLRDSSMPTQPQATETAKVEAPVADEAPQRRVAEPTPEEEAPTPAMSAPPAAPTPEQNAPDASPATTDTTVPAQAAPF